MKTFDRLLYSRIRAVVTSFAICALFILPAESQKSQLGNSESTRTFDGFGVKLTLSQKANAALVDRHETIMVAGYFYGAPKKGLPRKYIDDMGEVWVGNSVKAEIRPGEGAKFQKIILDARALERLDDQGPLLLINVFSGRRSSKNNLLSCDIYEGPLAKIEDQVVPIACKLIDEDHP